MQTLPGSHVESIQTKLAVTTTQLEDIKGACCCTVPTMHAHTHPASSGTSATSAPLTIIRGYQLHVYGDAVANDHDDDGNDDGGIAALMFCFEQSVWIGRAH